LEGAAGSVPVVTPNLTKRDRWGTLQVRLGFGRMSYIVEPGLYAVNQPGPDAPVLVTANYKLSFDHLRKYLHDIPAWILVLDTNGINVWCAAGKGTFGTAELCARIASANLDKQVNHREIIVPQLGAPGVAAHEVKRRSSFSVVYGPVSAKDLPQFLAGGMKATPDMRTKTFTLAERATLIPVELVIAMKWGLLLSALMFLLSGLGGSGGYFWQKMMARGIWWVVALWSGIIAGSVLTPLLLPFLPGRAFSVKGLATGSAAAVILGWAQKTFADVPFSDLELTAALLIIASVASFLGMEFTGASTYTSLSGVKKEMRLAVPAQIATGVIAVGLWIAARIIS